MLYRAVVFLIIFSFSGLWAEPVYTLNPGDVKKVMDELFEYHVDRKEISPVILERSLQVYLNQFDPRKAYLMKGEIDIYLKPTPAFLQGVQGEYSKETFASYFELNGKIQKSIIRARSWRQEWEKDPAVLVAEAKTLPTTRKEEEPGFAGTLLDLKQRHYEEFLKLIALHVEEVGSSGVVGKEAKLVALCEKQLTLSENDYLGLNEAGNSVGEERYRHFVVLRLLKALAHSLDDHTAYYSPDEAYAMKVQLEKGMCGIGVVLHEGIEGVMIADLLSGGPAENSGSLKKGDCIVEVNGESVRDFSFHKVLEVLRGEEGTNCVLGILRDAEKNQEFVRVTLKRSHITLDEKRVDVSSEPFGDGFIGKITLYSFYEGEDGVSSEKDIRKAIDSLREKGPLYGLVLDMRDNGGGFLSQAVRVSGLFISNGVVVISKYSDGSTKFYRAVEGRRFFDGPLVILISRGSASATEIVAQTLQDYGVALIVGDEQTYGKGTIQHQTVTSDRSQSFFKVTIGKYYTASGKSTQIEGVKSDIVVPTPLNFEKMGERYGDYPLSPDNVVAAYEDKLADLDPYAKKWFVKYYLPTLQKKITTWKAFLPELRTNSQKRLAESKNFQNYLKKIQRQEIKEGSFGASDLPMDESVNIIKDMIYFSSIKEEQEAA